MKPSALLELERSPCPARRREGTGSLAFAGDSGDAALPNPLLRCQLGSSPGPALCPGGVSAPTSCSLRGVRERPETQGGRSSSTPGALLRRGAVRSAPAWPSSPERAASQEK